MIHTLAYSLIFGQPLIMYAGLATLLSLATTATIGALNYRGLAIVPFYWHPRLAIITLSLAGLHAILGLSVFFGY
jgi:hypothetical protein